MSAAQRDKGARDTSLAGVDERSSPGSSSDASGAATRLAPAPAKVCAKCGRAGKLGYRVNRNGATVCTRANVCRRRQRNPRTAGELRVSDADYAAMLERQGGGCALCGTKPKARRLDVDHDHRTGEVRGLLCHRCNRALPTWVDVEWLAAASGYLGGPLP